MNNWLLASRLGGRRSWSVLFSKISFFYLKICAERGFDLVACVPISFHSLMVE